jgi:hypothetical protein
LTFAVLGDNRGDSAGNQQPVFQDIVRAVNSAAPELVLHVGDMINGYPGDGPEFLRRLWDGYRQAIRGLTAHVYHAPGNHDIFDGVSAGLWRELWGPTYYAFDQSGIRFIALDTESVANRLDHAQFAWLGRQLEEAGHRPVFVFLHRPLFPVNGHRGISLDAYPAQRDRLHQLFVRHRGAIHGVFQGHEHLYHFERRDGVPYYILGGGGEELYVPRELGGFHHFLLVSVRDGKTAVEVKEAGGVAVAPRPVRTVAPGAALEAWESTLFWYTWDHSVKKELTREYAARGGQGLKVWFDLARYEWPALIAPLTPARDLRDVGALAVDVFVPEELAGLAVTLLLQGQDTHEPAPRMLDPGWNQVVVELNEGWIPQSERAAVKELQWAFTARDRRAGWVVFDNFRVEPGPGPAALRDLKDGWQGGLLWGVWDQSVAGEGAVGPGPAGPVGLKVHFDFAKYDTPVLYASLNPLWDLSRVGDLTTDLYVPEGLGDVELGLTLTANGAKYRAPPLALEAGWNKVAIDLDGTWLAPEARTGIEQLEWGLTAGDPRRAGWVIFGPIWAKG